MDGFIFYKADNFVIYYNRSKDVFISKYYHLKKDYYNWMIAVFALLFVLIGVSLHEFYYPVMSFAIDVAAIVITVAISVILAKIGQAATVKTETVESAFRTLSHNDAMEYLSEAKRLYNNQLKNITIHVVALMMLLAMFMMVKNIGFLCGFIGLYYNLDCLLKESKPVEKYLFFKSLESQIEQ